MLSQFSPDQISAFWDGVAALATVVAAVVAIVTLRSLGRDSVDRTRPVLVAELRPVVLVDARLQLILSNVGASVARNVSVTFTPALPMLEGVAADGRLTPYLKRRYDNVISTWPPGMQLSNLYFVGVPGDGGQWVNSEPLADEFTVSISYEDAHGRAYSDSYELARGTWSDETTTNPSSTDERGMHRRWVRALEAIARGVGKH